MVKEEKQKFVVDFLIINGGIPLKKTPEKKSC